MFGQAFGDRLKQSLGDLAHGRDARADCHKTDQYGREVCKGIPILVDCLNQIVTHRDLFDCVAWALLRAPLIPSSFVAAR